MDLGLVWAGPLWWSCCSCFTEMWD